MLNNLQQQHLHYLREAMVGLRGWDAATDGWKTYQWIAMEGDHQWKTIGKYIWLLVSNMAGLFSISYMGEPFPLTNSYFSRWLKPPTSDEWWLIVSSGGFMHCHFHGLYDITRATLMFKVPFYKCPINILYNYNVSHNMFLSILLQTSPVYHLFLYQFYITTENHLFKIYRLFSH